MRNKRENSLYQNKLLRIHDHQFNTIKLRKQESTFSKLDNSLSFLLKLTPFTPVLGGVILLRYLYYIDKPELFMSSITSLNGLIAILLMGLLILFAITIVMVAPGTLTSYALKERENKIRIIWEPSFWRVSAPFFTFPVLLWVLGLFGGSFLPYLISLIVYLLSLWSLSPHLDAGTTDIKWWRINMAIVTPKNAGKNFELLLLAATMWLAVVFCSFPMLIFMSVAKTTGIQIFLVLSYQLIAVLLALLLWKIKEFKVAVFIIIITFCIAAVFMSDPILSGTAKLLGVRHDEAQWYWISNNKIVAILPPNMLRSKDGNYIFAATPFSYGDIKVVCTFRDKKIVLQECSTLDKSDVLLSSFTPKQ